MTLEQLREANGMRLAQWKPFIERRYPGLWPRLYGAITTQFGGALDRAGLGKSFRDPEKEAWRLRQHLIVEDAACEWLATVVRGIDARMAEIRQKERTDKSSHDATTETT